MKKPIICAVICLVCGSASGLSTASAIEGWYATLSKPSFNPPNWIFGPMWSLLYVLMGLAAGLVWNLKSQNPSLVKKGLAVFIAQFLLNLAWSPIFFGAQQIFAALIVIAILWLLILLCTVLFFRVRPIAGWLMVPYLLWVSFASALNFSFWQLNG